MAHRRSSARARSFCRETAARKRGVKALMIHHGTCTTTGVPAGVLNEEKPQRCAPSRSPHLSRRLRELRRAGRARDERAAVNQAVPLWGGPAEWNEGT